MKSVKELLSEKKDTLTAFDKSVPQGYPKPTEAPSVIMLKRKAIRVFPDNQKIALYYSDALDKYISIPFGPDGKALAIQISEEAPTEEQLNEFFQAALPIVMAGARAAAPIVGRGIAAAGRAIFGGGKELAGAGVRAAGRGISNVGKRALQSYRQRQAAGRYAKQVDKANIGNYKTPQTPKSLMRRIGGGLAAAGGAAIGALAGGSHGGGNGGSPAGSDYQFTLKPTVSAASSTATGANYVAREKQNQNQIWNNNSSVARRVDEQSIIEAGTVHGITITPRIAKKLVNVYESLNKQNQKKFEGMLSESAASIQKAINFAIRQ